MILGTTARYQDGYPVGMFQELSISSDGVITALFTNGACRDLYRIALAFFLNPTFLARDGVYYTPTAKSGPAVIKTVYDSPVASLRPGALELDTYERYCPGR